MTIQDQITDYLKELREVRRATDVSVLNYRSTLNAFARKHKDLTVKSVSSFVSKFPHAPTANTALTRLRGFAEFLDIDLTRVPRAKEIVKDPEAMSSREIANLLDACRDMGPEFTASVRLLASTGLRITEFLNLKQDCLQRRDGVPFLRIFGKGRKFRNVPLDDVALEAFQALKWPLLSDEMLRNRLATAGVRAGIPFRVNPHKLRSSFASILLNEKGADSAHVAKICGWSKVDTLIGRYYKPDIRTLHGVL